ncbi:hypothetical protein HN873_067315, partial [Arachis hypogaea]
VNTHLTSRPILLTRHGESEDNVRGRIGGDAALRYILIISYLASDSVEKPIDKLIGGLLIDGFDERSCLS